MSHGIPPGRPASDLTDEPDPNFDPTPHFSVEAVERAREALASGPYEPAGSEEAELRAKMRR